MSLLNVGARALLANQVALQTAGHNIANVNTAGYSRQTLSLQTVQGQFTGGGYIGQGVDVQTILRNHNELLTRQAAAANSTQAADLTRGERLSQMQDVFSGGTSGLGASITDMLNALSDVVAAPTDITARTVVLTRMDETAGRMRSAADRLSEIQYTVTEQLNSNVNAINSLASRMAGVNEQIARATGNGQSPNDLLDQRDQIIRELNQYVQTTQVQADDGTVGLFVAGSQPLVLGSTATQLSVGEATAFPGSGQTKLFFNRPGVAPVELDENMLGGGEVSGLLRFNNTDLAEGANLLGRMAQAIGMTMNAQHKQGLTLDGQPGKDLFSVPASMPGYTKGSAVGNVSFTDATKFAASDYEVRFTTPPAGQVVRMSDGKATAFTDLTDLAGKQIDGLNFNMTTAGGTGERVLFKPFSTAAANIQAKVLSPRDLAVASPVNASMGKTNGGSMQLTGVQATSTGFTAPPIPTGVSLSFAAGPPTTYTVTGSTTPPSGTAGLAYTPGQPIKIDGWELTLKGTPNTGDTVTVGNALDPQYGDAFTRNAGNATAMNALRDVKMFDESTMSDGYAGLMAQVGTRTQSALNSAKLSTTIAGNLEKDRTAVSGVNLDEEAAKLIQYQQAYQASAKVLQIAQSIFDSLIQTMGR
ncbi:flagellar hook-associated protein FlgK [Paracidovorax valerianellae]|uniref:Flagellar hook-associated protein 1 n=1 Tax=Paracidovorax valerianellae TaxID=187868 RepID=A0A1G7D4H0_9BURK|nr:flagellar hook-associated protein FlgK [Paracidovorax valerianellae]MDA8447251.1 flagellar hook-associated protein FlgK [Paracidovorax valerianellae]SDE45836.1 flagellar hook-associated protein 1 FlgK [Paracidovorax valerianellae]